MDRKKPIPSNEATPSDARARRPSDVDDQLDVEEQIDSEPPRTTTGHMTSPKFGSAGSGGAELEPGPER
jgi:hypothetical protein